MTKQNETATKLGNAYQHMEAVANLVAYRSHKSGKNLTNMTLVRRAREAEAAFQEAVMGLQEAFQDVFEENGIEFDKAYDMAKAAAESAAHSLKMAAWDELEKAIA